MIRGILGGTFDPIHVGHLRAAENARDALGLDRVDFVPVHVPPHRPAPASPALDRFAMVALATAGHPAFVASDLELQREGPSYTVETLAALRAQAPGDELVLIVGRDTYPEIPTWRESARVWELCTVAVVGRPSEEGSDAVNPESTTSAGVRWVAGPGIAVSATAVRARVREGRSIRYLVPETVADYITKRGLYR